MRRPNSKTNNSFRAESTSTECRSNEGVTVSIIDTISFLANLLSTRDLSGKATKAAIKDLQHDEKAWLGLTLIFETEKDRQNKKLLEETVNEIRKSKRLIKV